MNQTTEIKLNLETDYGVKFTGPIEANKLHKLVEFLKKYKRLFNEPNKTK